MNLSNLVVELYFLVRFLSMNITTDYPDNNVQNNSEPISYEYKWLETKDIRKYAEKLTKYTQNPTIDEDLPEGRNYMKQTPSFGHISVTPIPGLATTVWQSGTSEIVMRIFRPMEQLPVFDNINSKDYGSIDKNEKTNSQKDAEKQIEDMEYVISANKIRLSESTEETNSFMPMSSTYKAPKVKDYPTEEMEEDNIVYKPV